MFGGVSTGTPPTQVTHMAVGTGADDPADGQAGLIAEVAPRKPITSVAYTQFVEASAAAALPAASARVLAGGSLATPAIGDGVQRVRVSLKALFDFGEANGAVLREAGIFTAPAGGVMYNRVTFDAVTKTNAFQLTLLWDIVF
jgi:hypothetical protein